MLAAGEEEYVLDHARVPEHIPALMVGITRADFFLVDPFVCMAKDDWLIFIGYPLKGEFDDGTFSLALERALSRIRPAHAWFIAPDIPAPLVPRLTSREDDSYYRLELENLKVNRRLVRIAEKAAQDLTVSASRLFSEEHERLTAKFLERQGLPPRIHQLYLCMKDYLSFSKTSLVLSARDRRGRLSAYYILETGAVKFLTYVVGCHAKDNGVPHASDLLFYAMIETARRNEKEYIHLGLGVNEGISRFKKKWGGVPFLKYAFGEISLVERKPLPWIESLASKL